MFDPESLKNVIISSGVSFRENGKSFIFECPRCNKRNKLYIDKKEGYFCCFRCKSDGFKGRAEYALSELFSTPVNELKSKLYSGIHTQFNKILELDLKDYFDYEESAEFTAPELPEMAVSPNFVDNDHPSFQKGREYLINQRGVSEDLIRHYDIQYSPSEQCVVFPVKVENKLVGWQLRGINRPIKLTSKGLDKTKCLMFQDNLNNSEHCVLAEGPISTIKAHLCGGNVASMGKDVSETQLKIITSRVKRVYLGLDPDAANVTERICRQLYGEVEVNLLEPATGYEDLGDMSPQQVLEQFKCAKKAFGQSFFFLKDMKEMVF
jgi:hypothetical protein